MSEAAKATRPQLNRRYWLPRSRTTGARLSAAGRAVHVQVPTGRLERGAARLDPVPHEAEQPGVEAAHLGERMAFHGTATVQDEVVDVGLPRVERVGLVRIVEDHAVDDDVRL